MELLIEQLADRLTRVTPVGRWDIKGAEMIALKFSAATGSGRGIIVDMSRVEYLSSMGIRSLVMGAKAAVGKNARVVMLSPIAAVAEVLRTSHIDKIIPIHDDLAEAQDAVSI